MTTSFILEPEIEQRLDALTARTGRTKAFYLREIIQQGLDDIEDYYLASATLERVGKGEEKLYTADDLFGCLKDDTPDPLINNSTDSAPRP